MSHRDIGVYIWCSFVEQGTLSVVNSKQYHKSDTVFTLRVQLPQARLSMLCYPNDKLLSMPSHSSFNGLAIPPDTTSSPTAGIDIDCLLPGTEGAAVFDPFASYSEPGSAPRSAAPVVYRRNPDSSIGALHYTGFRKDIAHISLEAPTQGRRYLVPSPTSRREISAAMPSSSMPKRRLEDDDSPLLRSKTPRTSTGDFVSPGAHTMRSEGSPHGSERDDYEGVEGDAMAQARIEERRRKNTVAARRSRARKAEHVLALEEEVKKLRGQLMERDRALENALEELKVLRLAVGKVSGGPGEPEAV